MSAGTTCLVTGGAGFIGSNVVDRLVALGHRVRVVDNLSTGDLANLAHHGSAVEVIVGDLRDPGVCARAVSGVEIVFHVAALPSVPRSIADPWESHDANVNSTARLLVACREAGVRRVVNSGSSSVYGDTPAPSKVETLEPLPRSPYAASKLSAEQYVLAFARGGMLEGVSLRYFNVFGPRQSPDSPYAAVIPLFMRALCDGVPATVFGDGGQTRDFTYFDNVVAANLRAAFEPAERVSGEAVNVGAGERTSLLELIARLESVTGQRLGVVHAPPREGDVRESLAGLERVERVLGYRPLVRLEEGLRRTWDWFIGSRRAGAAHRPDARVTGAV
jgi:UDP-glucose 4-epimerase